MKDRSRGCTARCGVSSCRRFGIVAIGLLAGLPIVNSSASAAVTITVVSPGAADSAFALGDSIAIRWVYPGGAGSPIELKISLDSGLSYRKSLSDNKYYISSDTGEVHLTIPDDSSFQTSGAKILVRDYNRVDNNGESPIFVIRGSSAVRQGRMRTWLTHSSGCSARAIYAVNGRLALPVSNVRETASATIPGALPAGIFLRAAPLGTGGIRVLTTGIR